MERTDQGKPDRMLMLDALRGVAAIAVLLYHVSCLRHQSGLFDRGYLAVDFFYVLSGFVLAYPFERAANPDGQGASAGAALLMIRRIARLWPMMAVGTILGVAVAGVTGQPIEFAMILCGLLFLPHLAGLQPIFVFNNPQWSLLSELLANLLHVVVLRRLRTPWLIAIAIASWVGLYVIAQVQGMLTQGPEGATWVLGLWRVAFGYVAGVALARTQATWQHGFVGRLPWLTAPSALLVVLIAPVLFGISAALGDPLAVLAFVLIVAVGTQARIPPAIQRSAAWIGQISFPLYALHFPLLRLAEIAAPRLPDGWQSLPFAVATGSALVLAHFAGRSSLAKGLPLDRLNPMFNNRSLRSSPRA